MMLTCCNSYRIVKLLEHRGITIACQEGGGGYNTAVLQVLSCNHVFKLADTDYARS